MSWKCPYCEQNATVISPNMSQKEHFFDNKNFLGLLGLITTVIICPNEECQHFTLTAELREAVRNSNGSFYAKSLGITHASWSLVPQSSANAYPDYVPTAIRADYTEACLIRDLSPKASATLARRCLQGLIRDFYGVSKNRLVDEINAIQDQVDPLIWQAIDATRKIGNIGAHMERDINLIVDVEPNEAESLIKLIEILIRETYILRHERQERLNTVIQIAADKDNAKKNPTPEHLE